MGFPEARPSRLLHISLTISETRFFQIKGSLPEVPSFDLYLFYYFKDLQATDLIVLKYIFRIHFTVSI